MTTYLDGELVGQTMDARLLELYTHPVYLIFGLAVLDDGNAAPDPLTALPYTVYADWIRVA